MQPFPDTQQPSTPHPTKDMTLSAHIHRKTRPSRITDNLQAWRDRYTERQRQLDTRPLTHYLTPDPLNRGREMPAGINATGPAPACRPLRCLLIGAAALAVIAWAIWSAA